MFSESMPYRYMGRCGMRLSALGLGSWTTYGASVKEEQTIKSIVIRAYEAGINFFDMSDIYEKGEAEIFMGRVLRELPRSELVISSKLFWPMSDDVNDTGLSRKHIMESIDKSLARIGTDYLDIYFCHRPDRNTPIEETVCAMDDLVHRGKVLYWGTSEWSGEQIREACEFADQRHLYAPRVEQPQLNLVARDRYADEIQPVIEERGMGAVTWSPLASGLLSGKYDEGEPEGTRLWRSKNLAGSILTDENRERVRKFKAVAKEAGCTRAQLSIAWALRQPGVTSVITGATKLEQLTSNLGALKVEIGDELLKQINEIFPSGAGV